MGYLLCRQPMQVDPRGDHLESDDAPGQDEPEATLVAVTPLTTPVTNWQMLEGSILKSKFFCVQPMFMS